MPPARKQNDSPPWTGVAFVVEAMLLLVFLIGSLALFSRLYASSIERVDASRELTAAVALASSTAEQFANDPDSVQKATRTGDMIVTCDVTDEKRDRGTYHKAVIRVYGKSAEIVYSLTTSVYEGGVS